jgi:hypothetical protein
MKFLIFLAITAGASADSVQEVVDNLFDKYLPQKVTWADVKACHLKCKEESHVKADAWACHKACPKYDCPFKRISEQCDLFNTTLTEKKACHRACGHDYKCHFKCPKAMPTTMKELKVLGQAMACHKQCGHDRACHKACHKESNPWQEKQERCEKLATVVSCMRNGGSCATCPHLDEETKTQLMQEPWNLAKDVANHVVDYVFPLPAGQELSVEEVKACHARCAGDVACHKSCPEGVFGRFKDQCETLNETSSCHSACEQMETKCPVKKAECHFKCPMSMPTSVRDLKGLAEHTLCHAACGQNKTCHEACPNSNWDEKKSHCMHYNEMVSCHKKCSGVSACHATCPELPHAALNELKMAPSNLAKDLVNTLIV